VVGGRWLTSLLPDLHHDLHMSCQEHVHQLRLPLYHLRLAEVAV